MGDGKRKAKLKDTVPVCLVGDGREGKRHENIEISDEIKKLPSKAFDLGGLKRVKMSPGSLAVSLRPRAILSRFLSASVASPFRKTRIPRE